MEPQDLATTTKISQSAEGSEGGPLNKRLDILLRQDLQQPVPWLENAILWKFHHNDIRGTLVTLCSLDSCQSLVRCLWALF